jgi:hypothetical protein
LLCHLVLPCGSSGEGVIDPPGLLGEILHVASSLPIRFLPAAGLQDELRRNWTKFLAPDTRLLAAELGFSIYSLDSRDEDSDDDSELMMATAMLLHEYSSRPVHRGSV